MTRQQRQNAEAMARAIGDHLLTAKQIAEAMEISERTVYRYAAYARELGIPAKGAAGAGFMVMKGGRA